MRHGAPIAILKASQSQNWFGYNQGALEPGKTSFHAITANWTVPKASQHKKGEDESSSTWAGIGGGCVQLPLPGHNGLLGGSNRTVALQPVSIGGQVGLNLALGVANLSLRPGR